MKRIALFLLVASLCSAQSWQRLTNNSPSSVAGTSLLLRDGRVMVHSTNTQVWSILTPDSTGSYVNGTWKLAAPLPDGYAPNAFASAILPDGRLIMAGGEYNNGIQEWTNLAAIYDPIADTWTPIPPPTGWQHIGDAASVVLSDGTFMLANCCTRQWAILDPKTMIWAPTGSVLVANNNEASVRLLPDGTVQMVDDETGFLCGDNNTSTEIYDPGTGQWACGPHLPVQLWGNDGELGPGVLTYDQSVVQFGGLLGGTAVLDLNTNLWSSGPTPGDYNADDGSSALLPNGKILVEMRNDVSCQFMEYDPSNNTIANTANPDECPGQRDIPSHRLLLLPTGQVLFSHASPSLEIYTPAPGYRQNAAPTISPLAQLVISRGTLSPYVIRGQQLNGLSQATMKDDDAQQATNYPLVQLTSVTTGEVWYARTHDDSSSSIAPNLVGYTKFNLNPAMPAGVFNLQVITNGIPSNTLTVTVR